ncbi:MAG: cytochrome c maturation protein CcmE [Chloroflexota bacterium]|nr:cytochrome c maturation protein CcmE [Chloroflexota bacterium]
MTQLVEQAQSIPVDLEEKQAANKNLKFIIGGVLVIALIITLIVQATVSTGAYYLTVTELADRTPGIVGERVRVSGAVVDGSEDWNAQEVTLRFAISDEDGAQLPIVFYGPRPDNFQRAASAIVEGELLADGTFQAETLLLKCPSRYEEEPEEVFVEASR